MANATVEGPRPWPVVVLHPLLGPLALGERWKVALGVVAIVLAVLLLQVGAIAVWLGMGAIARDREGSKVRTKVGVGLGLYVVIWLVVAPLLGVAFDRRPLPCFSGNLRPHSVLYCLSNRHYVRTELAETALRIADRVVAQSPDTVVRYLDGGFPVGGGFPLLPHLSHGDGRRLDLALLWQHADGSPARGNGSPLGYFGYVAPLEGTSAACPTALVDLRWDMDVLQPVLSRRDLDVERTALLLREVLAESGIRKVLLETHVQERLGVSDGRVRFQGCRAARHDDHMHIQL